MGKEKNGRFVAPTVPAEKPAPKLNTVTRRLAFQLFWCLLAGAGIVLAYFTNDMSGRLSLILTGAALAVGAFHTGVWSQRIKGKGGAANG